MLLVLTSDSLKSQVNDSESRQFLINFEVSGPLFGLLRKRQPEISLAAIDECIAKMDEHEDGVRVERIIECGKNFKLALECQEINPSDLATIPVPCIIFFNETQKGTTSKTLCLVERVTTKGILSFDFNENKGWRFIPREIIPAFADKFVIKFKSESNGWIRFQPLIGGIVTILLFTWFGILIRSRLVKTTGKVSAAATLIILVLLSGCEYSKPSDNCENLVLSFVHNTFDLGLIDENPREIEIGVDVVAKSDVRISEIETSCGCLKVRNASDGEWRSSGERFSLTADLTTERQVGDRHRIIRIVANDRDGNEQVSILSVRYSVKAKPYASPAVLALIGQHGNPSSQAEFLVVCRRQASDRSFVIDWDRSELGLLKLVVIKTEGATYGEKGETQDDRFHMEAHCATDTWAENNSKVFA